MDEVIELPIEPVTEFLIIGSPDGGKLVSSGGELVWVSPAGARTILAGA